MTTPENIHGKETILKLLEFKFPIDFVIIENGSKIAENSPNYLKNDFYNPPPLMDMLNDNNIKYFFVKNHNDEDAEKILEKLKPDYIILGGTRILKNHILNKAKFGTLNAHPAMLPKYRGLDCIAWSILNGDSVGATVELCNEGIDTGDIILQETVDYSDCKRLIEVRIKVMRKCAELIIKSLIGIEFGSLKPVPQDDTLGIRHMAIPQDKLEIVESMLMHSTS